MPMPRRPTRKLMIGPVPVGGGAPVTIQSMTNTPAADVAATLAQIGRLADLGCEIIRVAVPDPAAASAFKEIAADSPLPVVADIHFDYRLALAAVDGGAAAIRLNPGNLADPGQIRRIAEKAGEAGIPIRVGSNSGSVRRELLAELERETDRESAMTEALVRSVLAECALLEQFGFQAIKVSLKSSSVPVTVAAGREFARRSDYPQHIGITEAGTPAYGSVKSAVGIGALLLDGIGDTLRVSLTSDPADEVVVARQILESCGLRSAAPEIIACPTCGRTEIDLLGLAERVERLIGSIKTGGRIIELKKIAVMGCPVNGPGEAREADLGLAGGRNNVVLFRRGEVVGVFSPEEGFARLTAEIMAHTRAAGPEATE